MIVPVYQRHLGELLADALDTWPGNVALVEASRQQERHRFTYRETKHAALRVAARLEAAGIGAGDRVAICMTNCSAWLITALGVLFRGAVLVPLDYKLSAAEQTALLAHSRARVLVTEDGLVRRFAKVESDHLAVELVLVTEAKTPTVAGPLADVRVERWEDLPDLRPSAPLVAREPDDPATIVYSSGTGGSPKGCVMPHRAYLAQWDALAERFPADEHLVFFSILPTNHAIDFMSGFVGPLCSGGRIVHQRTLRPEHLRWTMKEYGVTHMAVVPLLLESFERALRERLDGLPAWQRAALEALAVANAELTRKGPNVALSRRLLRPIHDGFGGKLEMLFAGGAFVPRERVEWLYRLGLPVVIGYGLTEACTVATVNDLRPLRGDSVGRPVKGVRVRVVGADADGVGEVHIEGPTLMLGYLDAPDLTEEAFADGWLRTGDLGRLDASGHLTLLGRAKNMVVTAGGKNVYPEDVENTLDAIPCDELCVLAENYVWPARTLVGEGLVVVVNPGEHDAATLKRALARANRQLPDYKRVRGMLLWRVAFPRTASMKVKRPVLAEQIRAATSRDAVEPLGA